MGNCESLPQAFSLPTLIFCVMTSHTRTLDADEPGDDEPVEEGWFISKKRKRSTARTRTTEATVPVMPLVNQEPTAPMDYLGDPTEQEVIDNVRNLPDIRSGGKVRIYFLNTKGKRN